MPVQELHDAAQLGGDPVGHEQQADAPGREIGADLLPEHVAVALSPDQPAEHNVRLGALRRTALGEACPQLVDGPVQDRIGRVVEHLPHHLAADARVGAALDLDQRRHAVLVEEEMVDRPAPARALFGGDALLARHQHEAARHLRVDLVARQQFREGGEQALEVILRGEARGLHGDERAFVLQHEDPCSDVHVATPPVLVIGGRPD